MEDALGLQFTLSYDDGLVAPVQATLQDSSFDPDTWIQVALKFEDQSKTFTLTVQSIGGPGPYQTQLVVSRSLRLWDYDSLRFFLGSNPSGNTFFVGQLDDVLVDR